MAQKIIRGEGALEKINDILAELRCRKVMLVCDGAYPYLPVKSFFDDFRLPVVKFCEFTPNPLYEDVCKGVELFNKEGCDVIIAVGGGSTIDVAKCIKLYCKMDSNENYLKQEYKDSGISLIAIPTTAGTGSEATRFAVIYYKGEKQSVTHSSIIPDYAVLAGEVLKSLPIYQKKCALLDALCQAIESWWSVNSNDESIEYSKKAIRLILDNIDAYLNEDGEISDSVYDNMLLAADYAGQAINITQTTAAHAMSYKLTSLYHIPHGHAVAICLPRLLKYMTANFDKCIDPRGSEYLAGVFEDISAAISVDEFEILLKKLDISAPVIPERDFVLLRDSVNPVRLKNNPVALSETVLEQLYRELE